MSLYITNAKQFASLAPFINRSSQQEIIKTANSKEKMLAYLNERVNYTDIGAGVEHFVEVGLSVYKLQLVELLVILYTAADISDYST